MFENSYQNKKVLVTGHTGFKGSWLIKWLEMLGAEVQGISLEPNTEPNHFTLIHSDIKSHILDIRDAEKLSKTIRSINPDIVFHLAAQPLVRESYEYPLETLQTNVMGTANVLNACRGLDNLKAILVVTTDKCYENKEWIWGYRESDPMGGYDPYSMSKGCAELVVSSFRRSYFNLDDYSKKHSTLLATARGGNVIGGGDWSKDRLIPDIIKSVVKQQSVMIRSPHSTRPWQHVLECLSGYLMLGQKLLQGEKAFAEAWNFGPPGDAEASVLDVLK
jgi:CDP-glucose 4,6-dehydratase